MGDPVSAHPLAGCTLPPPRPSLSIDICGPQRRLICWGDAEPFREALGLSFPADPCTSTIAGDRSVLWLGPDEWLLLAPEGDSVEIVGTDGRGAMIDVSHRQIGLVVAGQNVTEALNAGCPLDLRMTAFPLGMCTRTLFVKAPIILWRIAAEAFRIEVERSFAPYLVGLFAEIQLDLT